MCRSSPGIDEVADGKENEYSDCNNDQPNPPLCVIFLFTDISVVAVTSSKIKVISTLVTLDGAAASSAVVQASNANSVSIQIVA